MGIKNRLLIQMQYDASTNKYPMSFPLPMLLLKIINLWEGVFVL